MTNEEREALIAQGWTPPGAVDPDIAEARIMWAKEENDLGYFTSADNILNGDFDTSCGIKHRVAGIKRGRALAAAEAKPGMVWVKHNWSGECPVYKGEWVWIKEQRVTLILQAQYVNWRTITHYAIITPPEDK